MLEKDLSKSFTEIAESLLEKKTLDSVFDTITKTACSFFNASASSIMLFDIDKEFLTIVRSYNLSPEYLKVVKVRKDQEIAGKVCQEKKPRFVVNALKLFQDIEDNFTVQWVKKEGLITLVCAPLLLKDEPIGCLNIYYRYQQDTFADWNALDFFTKLAALSIEHSRLIEEIQNNAKMFSVLGEIGLFLASSFDINEIMKTFLSTATYIINADAGGLILIDPEKSSILEAYEYNKGESTPKRYTSSAHLINGISSDIIRTKKPVVISDTGSHPNVNPVILDKKYVAIIGVPLISKEKIMGILYVNSLIPRNFTKEEVDYLSILSNYAAVALENSKLYEKIALEAKETAILYEVSQSFISSLDFEQLLKNILRRLIDTFGYLNLAVFLIDEESQELKLISYINYPDEVKNMKIKIGEVGITGHVALTKKMYYSPDVTNDPYYIKGVEEARSEVCLPLMIGDRVIGVLDVESPENNGFTQDDIKLLSSLCAQIAIALENCHLYEEAKKLSLTDPLTMLPNRRNFDIFIDTEIKRAERYRRPFSILMIDFDNFKNYNDKFGHTAGDSVLQKFALLMKESIRDVDFVGRYGGDEFVVILPETGAIFAWEVAERMRKKIAAQSLNPNVTLSIGIATFPDDSRDKKTLINLADQACYEAKQMGGNCVNFATKPTNTKEEK